MSMINDITFCVNKECPNFNKCKRADHPKEGIHSYSDFKECDGETHFIPRNYWVGGNSGMSDGPWGGGGRYA
jgi:hypothetical protein